MSLRLPKRLKTFQTKSHARAPKQEAEIAERIGGRVVRGSGSGNEKGDSRKVGIMRVEAKTTKHSSFRVTRDMLRKIEEAAINSGEVPVMEIEFIDENGKPVGSVCVAPTWVLEMVAGSAD